MNTNTHITSPQFAAERRADCYAKRMAHIEAICTQVLDGRIWQEFGRSDAQQALASIREFAAFKLPV